MCLIVDANRAAAVFGQRTHPDSVPIRNWLARDGCIVYGGRLLRELGCVRRAIDQLAELKRPGKASLVAAEDVDREERDVRPRCRSNDPHVIALARVSGARVLCAGDSNAMTDFCDPALVSKPKVYQRAEHARLLRHSSGCPRSGPRRTSRQGPRH
jgi:hypothetical protein